MQPESPTQRPPNPHRDEVEKIAGDLDAEGTPKKDAAPPAKASPASVAVHTTVPINKSLAKLKAHRKPRKPKTTTTEVQKNGESKIDGRPDPPDARSERRGGFKLTVLPLDWFRK